ncbi:MAG: glycosyltransferase family 4 protein [Clostridia bacterium]|nr:glycosyltransferase family 4 protein [Clostridia bacterium]
MRFLFVAPRFHTNQYPTSRGLIEHGHEVFYLVQSVGASEDHSFVEPRKMELSLFGKIRKKRLEKKFDAPTVESRMISNFIPSCRSIRRYVKEVKPDIVILRDRIPSTLKANFICRRKGIKTIILYNQTELYVNKNKKNSPLQRIVFALMPKVRYTISKYHDFYDPVERPDELCVKPHEYFVPYVCPPEPGADERGYLGENGEVRLLCVGKYRPYKNQQVLIRALSLIKERGKIDKVRLTLIGQAVVPEEHEYLEATKMLVAGLGLEEAVEFRKSVPYSEMADVYRQNDVMILPSKDELASISVLESMSHAVLPISTNKNGSAFYITEGETGLVFRTDDPASLADCIERLIDNPADIPRMGKAGYEYLKHNCMYENYRDALGELLEKEFSVKLEY